MNIEEELLKRYNYLNDNKELILANCIIYDIEKDYIKKQLKSLKRNIKNINKDNELTILIKNLLQSYKEDLKKVKPYLSSNPSREYIDMLEELILGDTNIEETTIYKHIEYIKGNKNELKKYNKMIEDLEERRGNNYHLRKIPTFTVWKILSYIRKKYKNNIVVLSALDKYYNLDRYTIANEDCKYGYYITEYDDLEGEYPDSSIYSSANGNGVVITYRENEFEEEDNYYDIKNNNHKSKEKYYPSQFTNELANLEMIQNKKDILKTNNKIKKITTTK